MKKPFLTLSILFAISIPCYANDYIKFIGGVVLSSAIHESGHVFAGAVTETPISWTPGTYNQPVGYNEHSKTKSAGFTINASGLFFQTLSAEMLLDADSIDKNDALVRGMLTYDIINAMSYTLDYWIFKQTNKSLGPDHYQGDIKGVEFHSNKTVANIYATSISAISVCHAVRFLKTQNWVPDWVKSSNYSLEPVTSIEFTGMTFKYNF